MKIARPVQQTLDTCVKPVESEQKVCTTERKKRPRKVVGDTAKSNLKIVEFCKSYSIKDDDAEHIIDCLGISEADDFINIENEELGCLHLHPDVETRLKQLISDVKKNKCNESTSMPITETGRGKRQRGNSSVLRNNTNCPEEGAALGAPRSVGAEMVGVVSTELKCSLGRRRGGASTPTKDVKNGLLTKLDDVEGLNY